MQHAELVYNLIDDKEKVLDVGGAYQPFLRADNVIDIIPYASRDVSNIAFGGVTQRFTEETWVTQDICDYKKPWPFKDKEFDFCVCSHVLEDLRDPIHVVSEMTRVAKRGYIEVPSRYTEQTVGKELPGICGYGHHRWIVDTEGNRIRLVFKCHELHAPVNAGKWHLHPTKINPKYNSLGIFWEGNVECFEKIDINLTFTRNYFEETKNQSKAIPDFNAQAAQPTKIPNPFLNDGMPHVHVLSY